MAATFTQRVLNEFGCLLIHGKEPLSWSIIF